MAKVTVKVEKITKVINRETLLNKALNTLDFGEDNVEGKKYTVRKCIENMREIDLTSEDGKIRFSMGNTDGYWLNTPGLFGIAQSIMEDSAEGISDYIPVVIGYKS